MALTIGVAFGDKLFLIVISRHFGTRSRFRVGNLIHKHVDQVVAAHLSGHGEVADHYVFLLLHIVIICVAVRIAPVAVVAVFFVVITLAIPIIGFTLSVFRHLAFHLVGSQHIVGRTEVERQLIHRAWLHVDVVGEHDRVGLPLREMRVIELQTHFFLKTTDLADAIGVAHVIILNEG